MCKTKPCTITSTVTDCLKGAQDSKGLFAHGGGPRCTVTDCLNGARDSKRLCIAHGEGLLCTEKDCF
jgi:hypothetical protein